MSYVAQVAQRIVDYDPRAMRSDVRSRLCSCLLFNLSVGMAGWDSEDPVHRAFLATHAAPGPARVLVEGRAIAAADAAFVNAGLITARSQNDTHTGINGHIGCVVVPAVLALAREGEVNVADLLAALAVGYEVPLMIAQDVAGEIGKRGFRGTSIFAVFGAAAASARLLRLDAAQTAHALAIASNFSGGLMQCWEEGTIEWRIQVAHASRAGVVAAQLALHGMQGASRALEGSSGFYRAFAGIIPPMTLPADLCEVLQVNFKPYPGCTINQPAVHAVLTLVAERALDGKDVEALTVWMNPAQAQYPGVCSYGPFSSEAGAVMSAPFMLELVLEHGGLKRSYFQTRYAEDPIHAGSRRVRVEADAALAPYTCRVRLLMRDGSALVVQASGKDLALDWDAVVALAHALSGEWPHPEKEAQFAALYSAIDMLRCGPWDQDALQPLMAAIWMQ